MRRTMKLWLVPAILLLTIGLFGQESKSEVLSFSLSYIHPTIISHKEKTEYEPIHINFEAIIHYKPFDRISFSSGLGYNTSSETWRFAVPGEPNDPGDYLKLIDSNFYIPIQFNYHIKKNPDKDDWYLKAVYKNGISAFQIRDFDNDELVRKETSYSYEPWGGIGIGSIFLKNKPVGIIVEGTIEKYLNELFKYVTRYYLKIGVVF